MVNPETIKTLEERLLLPEVRKSAQELSTVLADEFIEFGSYGQILNKEQVIKALQSEQKSQITMSDFQMRPLAPDLVLAMYQAIQRSQDGEERYTLRSSIWKLTTDKWQIIFHQGTPISKSI